MTTPRADVSGHVLLVDDEPALLAAHEQILTAAGFDVTACKNGDEALQRITPSHSVEAVITDISMPGISGLELLRQVRKRDVDLPVLLLSGKPSIQTATEAVSLGALKYMVKPINSGELVSNVHQAVKLYRLGRAKREALTALGASTGEASDRAGLEASFNRAYDTLWVALQPIVKVHTKGLFGYEALLRSREPSLPHPGAVLDAAERLGKLDMLGRRIRELAIEAMERDTRNNWSLFVNLHPLDLLDDELLGLLERHQTSAKRIVLELTERASLDHITNLRGRIEAIRKLGVRLAIDDLGAGYAGLSSFVQLEPDIVKLDMSLIRDCDKSTLKQKLIGTLTKMCSDMSFLVVAEGIETAEERDTAVRLGCHLLQGYRHGRPGPPFVEPVW